MDQSGTDDLECSLHYLPKPLMREFSHVFNDEYLKFSDNSGDAAMSDAAAAGGGSTLRLLAIPTNQRAREDLVQMGDHIEQEKDRLLNVVSFFAWREYYFICEMTALFYFLLFILTD